MNKEIKRVMKYALSKGFVRVYSRKHAILKYGNRRISLSCSPSSPFGAKNAMKDVERVLKEEQ